MIQKITAFNSYKNNNYKNSFKTEKSITPAIQNQTNLNKAYYLPSFGSSINNKEEEELDVKNKALSTFWFGYDDSPFKKINFLKPEERMRGTFYNELSDNVSILLNTDKNIILTKNKELLPEIFAQNLTRKIEKSSYTGIGFSPLNTDVLYIENPQDLNKKAKTNRMLHENNYSEEYSPQENILDKLSELSSDTVNKIVIINNFEYVLNQIKTQNKNSFLKKIAPNVNIIGIVNENSIKVKSIDKKDDEEIKTEYKDFRRLPITGLTIDETKEFFEKNYDVVNDVLQNQKKALLSISSEALNEVVERSANKVDTALPNSALTALNMIAAAKMQKLRNLNSEEVNITKSDVNKFFANHSVLFDDIKPQTGKFSLVEKSNITLKDLGGMSTEKQIVQEDIIPYLKNPKKFLADGGVAPGGILLKGTPGNGKTYLAKALAGETNTPFITASGSDFVEMYVGVGPKRVRDLYGLARTAAENSANKSAIVFIDEIDAVGKKRGGSGSNNSETEKTLNQILVEMDGFNSKESPIKIITIAATNRPDILDDALTRPGRFDYSLEVRKPKTNQDRFEVLQIHSKKLPFESEEEKTKILENAAKSTKGCSNAEISGIMKKVQMLISKRDTNKFVTPDDIIEGLLTVNYGTINKAGSEKTEEEKLETLVHEYGHGVGIDFLSPLSGDTVDLITLDERGDFLGMVKRNHADRNPNFKSVILSAVISHLGGMYEPNYDAQGRSAGVSQDIDNASTLIQKAITEWGEGIFTPPVTLVSRGENETEATKEYRDTIRKANEKNIAKDTLLFATLTTTIALMIKKLHKGSEKQYVDLYLNNVGKGGNNLSGEAFSKMRNSWLVANGKEKQAKKLLSQINTMLEEVRNIKSHTFKKLMKQVNKSL